MNLRTRPILTSGRLASAALVVCLASACGDDTTSLRPEEPAILRIALGDSVLSPGEVKQYTVDVLDERGDPVRGVDPTWSVSNTALATIDESGELTTTGPLNSVPVHDSLYVVAVIGELRDSIRVRVTTSWSRISVGETGSCAISASLKLYCWGSPRGTTAGNGFRPVPVESTLEYGEVYSGVGAACGIVESTQGAQCWGLTAYGRLGTGSGATGGVPEPVTGGFLFRDLSIGREHGCGVTVQAPRDIVCWGKNAHGEVGDSVSGTGGIGGHPPTIVVGGYNWAQVSARDYRTCGLTNDHVVYCWGRWAQGAAGLPASITTDVNYPVAVETSHRYVRIAVGGEHQCALPVGGGSLECWGRGQEGQLGVDSAPGLVRNPQAVAGGHAFAEFSTGETHTCAVDLEGKGWCWGDVALGHATITTSPRPVEVAGNHRFASIATGTRQSCGITVGGAVYCWGEGALGDGLSRPNGGSFVPVRVLDP